MFSAIGLRTTRQLRLAGVCSAQRLAVCFVPRGAITAFRRGFFETRRCPEALKHKAAKPKAAKTKATKAKSTTKETTVKEPAARKTRKPRVLTEEQKAKRLAQQQAKRDREKARKAKEKEQAAKRKRRGQIQELKRTALLGEVPNPGGYPRNIFALQVMEGKFGSLKTLSESMKYITDAERERLTANLTALKAAAKARYQAFLDSKTPVEILEANKARTKLNALKVSKKPIKPIEDPRNPKLPVAPFMQYTQMRWQSEGLKNQVVTPAEFASYSKQFSEEWRALSEADRQPYVDLYERDKQRYVRECEAAGLPARVK